MHIDDPSPRKVDLINYMEAINIAGSTALNAAIARGWIDVIRLDPKPGAQHWFAREQVERISAGRKINIDDTRK